MNEVFDIVVVGGGFAGASAAISAARMGKRVLLIEKYNCMGGAAVYDLVNPFMPYFTNDKSDPSKRIDLSCGLFEEIVKRIIDLGGAIPEKRSLTFNEEILKFLLNEMAIESGVELLYQTVVTDVKIDNLSICSLEVSNVSGKSEIFGKCFIDATGDANIAYLCGCPYTLGRETDNLCQPMTLCFRLSGVKNYNSELKARINAIYKEWQRDGKITNPRENVLIFKTMVSDILHFNTTRVVKLDPTDANDITKAEIIARRQVMEIYNFLRQNFDEFKDSTLISTGLQIGVRESRMICGEYTLTKEDLLSCAKFDDSVAVCNYDIDIHSPDGSGTSHYYFPAGEYYSIPYRCLIPKKITNLLVAGRCISATHDAQASLRIMPTCSNLGEAAGVAAALSAICDYNVRKVSIEELQSRLLLNGAKIK
jgi:hypothetical protein